MRVSLTFGGEGGDDNDSDGGEGKDLFGGGNSWVRGLGELAACRKGSCVWGWFNSELLRLRMVWQPQQGVANSLLAWDRFDNCSRKV